MNPDESTATLAQVLSSKRFFLDDVDGRTASARRYKALAVEIANDRGGADNLSESQRQLVKRIAGHALLAERIEADLIAGKEIDADMYVSVSTAFSRLVSKLGLDRVAREVNLESYIQGQGAG